MMGEADQVLNAIVQARQSLAKYARNQHSQFGEDGILEKIFQMIGIEHHICIEFGAWDGFHLSNTAALWEKGFWKGILIEGDPQKCRDLKARTAAYNCLQIESWVGIDPTKDSLEFLLKQSGQDLKADLLSIDIDGNDYHIFRSLQSLRPRVIVCEYNPTIPYYLDIFAEYGNYFGCSIKSLIRVAREKGYSLVALTETNGIFVRNDFLAKFENYETRIEMIAITRHYNHVVTDYSGKTLVLGSFPYGKKTEALGCKVEMLDSVATHGSLESAKQ